MRELSDLEFAVLGAVWRQGNCTAYQVRKRFLESPSSHWSGSAGAIYPLMRRLDDRGLLSSRSTGDARRTRQYDLTESGRQRLRAWLQPPLPDRDIAHAFDPIRARLFFLDVLEPAAQTAFVDAALEGLVARAAVIAADCETREGDPADEVGYLAARGALYSVRAQISWLREVRSAIGRSNKKKGSSRSARALS